MLSKSQCVLGTSKLAHSYGYVYGAGGNKALDLAGEHRCVERVASLPWRRAVQCVAVRHEHKFLRSNMLFDAALGAADKLRPLAGASPGHRNAVCIVVLLILHV